MLKDILKLKKEDILSIVGSGGKTTTMYMLGEELSNSRVLLTTSTKIRCENPENIIKVDVFEKLTKIVIENVNYLSGNTIIDNKFTGVTNEQLETVIELFDYIIVEADGSKTRALKGWRENEPVILKRSNKTLGIIPFDLINEKLENIDIFNRRLFFEIVGKDKKYFDIDCISKIIEHKNGIFKNSDSKKYILFNKCDNFKLKEIAKDTIKEFGKLGKDIKFIYGSSKVGEYYEC